MPQTYLSLNISNLTINFIARLQLNRTLIYLTFNHASAFICAICETLYSCPNSALCVKLCVLHVSVVQSSYLSICTKYLLMKRFLFTCILILTTLFAQAQNQAYITYPASDVGIDSTKLLIIDSIAHNAIIQHAFPGCEVLVARNGKVVLYKTYGYLNYDSLEPVTQRTIYDLASVTKVSATTMGIMRLFEEGKLDLNKPLGDYLPWLKATNKEGLILEDILLHQAGLVAFIPFYKETINAATGQPLAGFYQPYKNDTFNIRVADNMYLRKDWMYSIYREIAESSLLPSCKYVYSDNDFILLGKVIEQLSGKTLDVYTRENFYAPLHMRSTGFKPRENYISIADIAPTEKEKYFRQQLLRGDVHDPGAAMFGGVAGHAGLFSNAYDLAQLYLMLLNGGKWNETQYFKKETIDYFTGYHSDVSRRGYGFDKPEKDNATNADPYPSKYASPQTFGHTGFTGTCVWADPKENLLFIFLSNRVCPDMNNGKLGELGVRRNMLDAVYKAIGR